ncbi:unnamed protein product [marine sediment metagenome]|uniref:Uncharacterized protein n=1 Tax=marine sediment metagenome TaxID=412755 RepID=X1G707_9ZZZZ
MVRSSHQRRDKYEAKIDGRIIGQKYEDTKKLAATKQGPVFKRQVEIEEKVKVICEGVSSILLHYYIDYANEFNKWKRYDEREIIFTKWKSRGLNRDLLGEIGLKLFGWRSPYLFPWYYLDESYPVIGQDNLPMGIFWDGVNWWMVGRQFDKVYKYTAGWGWTGISFPVGGQDWTPHGIFWDGVNWWMVGIQNTCVYKYTAGWGWTGISFPVGGQDNTPTGIFWDGVNWWMCGRQTDTVYKYDLNWNYTGVSYPVGKQDIHPEGIFWDGVNWWMVGSQNDSVYKYTD